MATAITRLYTNPHHGEKQVSIELGDSYYSVTFNTSPDKSTVGVWTHPTVAGTELSPAEVDDLIAKLTELRKQLPRH